MGLRQEVSQRIQSRSIKKKKKKTATHGTSRDLKKKLEKFEIFHLYQSGNTAAEKYPRSALTSKMVQC